MKPNQTRMTACRQNPLCNTGRTWRSVSLAPEFLHKFFRLSCLGSALNSNVSLETRMCMCVAKVLYRFQGSCPDVLITVSKKDMVLPRGGKGPWVLQIPFSTQGAQISAQSTWSPPLHPYPTLQASVVWQLTDSPELVEWLHYWSGVYRAIIQI